MPEIQTITAPVTRLYQETSQAIFDTPIGTTGEYVELKDANSKKINLQQFYDNWRDFRENNNFIYYGQAESNGYFLNNQIKMWYDPIF